MKKISLKSALQITWPVMLGYFPMGAAFGLLCKSVFFSALSGVWVYAGASQFLSVKLMENHALMTEIWLSVFFLNLRHVFYSLHFLNRYRQFPFWIKLYSIFSLTDETYAVLASHSEPTIQDDARLVVRVSFLNHFAWASGCVAGAVLSSLSYLGHVKGLDFFLVGLFVVLLVERLKKDRTYLPLALATVVGTLALLTGSALWLFWAMGICVIVSLGVSS